MPLAFITGGTSGIGYATARRFHKKGYRVFITGRREEFGEFNYIKADVRDFEEIKRAFDSVGEGVDVLIVNAGIGRTGYVEYMSVDDWNDVINTNLNGAFYTVKAGLPHMKTGGSIIFVGSVASIRAFEGWSAYCASKYGLLALASSLGEELKGRIRVGIILPGAVDTNIWNSVGYKPSPDSMLKPDDVADAIINMVENGGWVREVLILPKGGVL